MNTKHISEVWLPGEGNSHNEVYRVGSGGITRIELVNTYHGDHDEAWLIISQGEVTRHVNPRQITEIVYKDNEPNNQTQS